jgi:hypothetical protein
MSLVSGTRDGRKVYSNVLCVNLTQTSAGQINDGMRRPRLDGAEQFRIDRVDGKGRWKLFSSQLTRPRGGGALLGRIVVAEARRNFR